METDELIRRLAADAAPVSGRAPASRRAIQWLGMIGIALAVVVFAAGRPDFAQSFAYPPARDSILIAVTMTLAATASAFALSVPGRSVSLPLVATLTVIWLATIAPVAFRAWSAVGFSVRALIPEADCIGLILALAPLPALLLAVQLRRSASPNPLTAGALSGIAVAGPVWVGLRGLIFHAASQATDMFVEQLGMILVAGLLGGLLGLGLMGRISPSRLPVG